MEMEIVEIGSTLGKMWFGGIYFTEQGVWSKLRIRSKLGSDIVIKNL